MARKLPENFGAGHKFEKKGNEEHRNHVRTMEMHYKLHQQDWRNVIVCNMHPFSVQQHFGDAGLLVIKGCPEGQPYNAHKIDMYRTTKRDEGEGKWTPEGILPVELAQEITRKYTLQGGVFWFYEGDKVPMAEMEAARARQLNYYRSLVRKGKDEWARYHNNARVSDAMRASARYLAALGELNLYELEWVDKQKMQVCEQCGEDYKPGAKICKHCEYPIDFDWVRKNRKDLASRFGLTAPSEESEVAPVKAPKNMEELLDGKDEDPELV